MNENLSDAYAPLTTPDTNNATSIEWQSLTEGEYPTDGYPGETTKDRFKNLDLTNQGAYNFHWENSNLVKNRLNDWGIKAIASQLELRPWQSEQAASWIHSLQLNEWGISAELIMFSICLTIVHSDERDVRRVYPNSKGRDPAFTKVQSDLGITNKDAIKTYAKLKQYFRTNEQVQSPQFDRWGTDRYEPEIYQNQYIRGVVAGEPQFAPTGHSDWA